MNQRLWIMMVGIALSTLTVVVPPGQTQDIPAEGRFSVTYVLINPTPFKPLPVGKDREVTMSATLATAVNDGGSGLLHNMAGRCITLSTLDKAAKTLDIRGYCNYADRAGDQVYEEFTTPSPQPIGSGMKINGKWIGGSGKYAGLSGEFEITNSGNLSAEGPTQSAGKKIGSYKISK
jgi:hypothetical protein